MNLTQGLYANDSVRMGQTVEFTMEFDFTPGDGSGITGSSNGFQVWTYGGTNTAITYDTTSGGSFSWGGYDGGVFQNYSGDYPVVGRETIGLGGFALFQAGITDGMVGPAFFIQTVANTDQDTLCVDSTFYPPSNSWLWSTNGPLGAFGPGWAGPYCYHVYFVPDEAPTFDNCPSDLTFDHCLTATYDFDATDPEGSTVNYVKIAGPGTVNATTGEWSYAPGLGDVPGPIVLTVGAFDIGGSGDTTLCDVDLYFTNTGPVFTGGCDEVNVVGMGNEVCHQFTATDDCDPFTFFVGGVTPTPVGPYSIDPNTGLFCFDTDNPLDGGGYYEFDICVTDGVDTTCCKKWVDVLVTEPFEIVIEKTHMSLQGQHEYVDVTVTKGSPEMGGFDILVAYDRTCTNFQGVFEGSIYAACGWEYFTYRTWFFPSYYPHFFWGGIIRVVGMAELNNGANHPSCWTTTKPFTLFTIDFLVTDNRQFECQYCPVRFYWTDCGDNTISSKGGDTLFVSRNVFEFGDPPFEITDMYYGFPTYFGTQWDCLIGGGPNKPVPVQFIDFINGGVDVACADSLDDRGDINLNGISNEIADAVLFTNYFIYGVGVFKINYHGQVAATDVNADGLTLTVGDLVYLVRVIVGDAMPYPKLAPVEATYVIDHGVISVDAEMGAALVVVKGNATPTLLAENMDIKYAYDAEQNLTRLLVYSLEGHGFSGEFVQVNGEVVSLELGSYEGAVVKATEVPADFALNQNYPNPFNPTTTVSFNLPVSSDYTLSVYNVTGQVVHEINGSAEAGVVELDINANDWASGIYFYKLNAGDFSATKKMVLLK
jgi:hypothetical protein